MDDTPEVQLEARSFVWTIKNGDLDALAEFVKSKKFNVNTLVEGRFPIHYAADYGQYDLIKFLLSNGAKVNELDRHGISPLLAAIWEGHTECVKLYSLMAPIQADARPMDDLFSRWPRREKYRIFYNNMVSAKLALKS